MNDRSTSTNKNKSIEWVSLTRDQMIDLYRCVSGEMKPLVLVSFSLGLFFGCDGPHRDVVPQRYADFESAIEAMATSKDIGDANAAAVQLYAGGIPAIDALRRHLRDDRVIPSGFCSRSLSRYDGLTIAEQARWSIQDMIETGLPKVYDDSYYVLRDGDLEQWLDERKGMSFIELQMEAARAQLDQAKRHMATGKPHAEGAIAVLKDRLAELGRSSKN